LEKEFPVSILPEISIYFSLFSKDYGILTKEMRLENDVIIKDASQCRMASGSVQTVSVANLLEFAELLKNLTSNQAIGRGVASGYSI
jgi:folate-dependent tRNA-U54 methylase TrmFO/GidA